MFEFQSLKDLFTCLCQMNLSAITSGILCLHRNDNNLNNVLKNIRCLQVQLLDQLSWAYSTGSCKVHGRFSQVRWIDLKQKCLPVSDIKILYLKHFSTKIDINPQTSGNARVHTQHCGYWCPDVKVSGQQYQCWPDLGPICGSHRTTSKIWKKM